jgi:hypothetical protein
MLVAILQVTNENQDPDPDPYQNITAATLLPSLAEVNDLLV